MPTSLTVPDMFPDDATILTALTSLLSPSQ